MSLGSGVSPCKNISDMCFRLQRLYLHDIDSDWMVYSGLVLHPRLIPKHFSTILCLIWRRMILESVSVQAQSLHYFLESSFCWSTWYITWPSRGCYIVEVYYIIYLHNVATSYLHAFQTTSGSCYILAFACTLLPLNSYTYNETLDITFLPLYMYNCI